MKAWVWLSAGWIVVLIGVYILLRGLSQRKGEDEEDEEWPLGI